MKFYIVLENADPSVGEMTDAYVVVEILEGDTNCELGLSLDYWDDAAIKQAKDFLKKLYDAEAVLTWDEYQIEIHVTTAANEY